MMHPQILVINTGSTSTKLALYEAEKEKYKISLSHTAEELQKFKNFDEAIEFRLSKIQKFLKDYKIDLENIDLFMCRGGLIRPVASGVYQVNEKMIRDLKNASKKHASNLAAVLGYNLSPVKNNVYIADPVVVDEMQKIARYSGHKNFERKSIFHALNHKAVARSFAAEQNKNYEDLNLIIVHLGGGISVGAHKKGKVVDVNQALDGEGPFSPERSGTLPTGDLLKEAFSGKYTLREMEKMLVGQGGIVSYLGTNDMKALEKSEEAYVQEVIQAMTYQISKYIGEMAVVLRGKIDAIILTGGLAHSQKITEQIKSYVEFLAPVYIFPGEDEMKALAYNGNLVWNKFLIPKEY